MGLIYKIENDINNKIYIGKTTKSLQKRWKEHITIHLYDDTHFHRAILKYGANHFHPIIIENNIPNELLNEREQYWIEYYDSYNNGYNSTIGGDGRIKFPPDLIIKHL